MTTKVRIATFVAVGLLVIGVMLLGHGQAAAAIGSGGKLPAAVPTSAATATAEATATGLPHPQPTGEATATGLPHPQPTGQATATLPAPLPTVLPTDCPNLFVDVQGNVFYTAIHTLNCGGVINGTDATHFSPRGTATRAQFAKIVVRGFGLNVSTPSGQSFSDVPADYFAYAFIESGLAAGILSGYTEAQCAAANATHPCYLPNRNITRAELTRLVVKAARYTIITPEVATFVDVPTSNFAFSYIETAYLHGVVNGVDATHFQPGRNIRRDEMAQIVYAGVTTP